MPVCKNRFEKSARIFSRRYKQTTFSDAVFLGALRVKKFLDNYHMALRKCLPHTVSNNIILKCNMKKYLIHVHSAKHQINLHSFKVWSVFDCGSLWTMGIKGAPSWDWSDCRCTSWPKNFQGACYNEHFLILVLISIRHHYHTYITLKIFMLQSNIFGKGYDKQLGNLLHKQWPDMRLQRRFFKPNI